MDKKRDSFFLLGKKQKPGKDKQNGKGTKAINSQENGKHKREENFDKNRDISEQNQDNPEKKPFDKKTYRLKKYSKKYKLEQWEEQRKKRLLREYHKDTKNDPMSGSYKPISFDEDTVDNPNIGKYVRHPDLVEKENQTIKKKRDPFQKAKEQFNKIKQDKEIKQQEIARAREERKQKLEEYKKKKQDRFKKLSKKTKKGQPVMTGRLEMLLEKIQKG